MLNVSSDFFFCQPCSFLFEGVAERNIKDCKLQYRNACLYLKIFLNCKGMLEVSPSSPLPNYFFKQYLKAESPFFLFFFMCRIRFMCKRIESYIKDCVTIHHF